MWVFVVGVALAGCVLHSLIPGKHSWAETGLVAVGYASIAAWFAFKWGAIQ